MGIFMKGVGAVLIVSPGCVRRFTLDLKNLDVMDERTKQNHKLLPAWLCKNKNIY